jgi:hypothetical protein
MKEICQDLQASYQETIDLSETFKNENFILKAKMFELEGKIREFGMQIELHKKVCEKYSRFKVFVRCNMENLDLFFKKSIKTKPHKAIKNKISTIFHITFDLTI